MANSIISVDQLLQSARGSASLFSNPQGSLVSRQEPSVRGDSGTQGKSLPFMEGFSSARISSLEISVQYHMERNIQDRTGRVLGRETLDIFLKFQSVEIDLDVAGRGEPEVVEDTQGAPNPFEKLLEHFNVENTAQRIASFVKSGFGRTSFGETDAADSRQAFVDFITPHIREGVSSALAMFGELPDEIRQMAEDTYSRTEALLGEFAGDESAFA